MYIAIYGLHQHTKTLATKLLEDFNTFAIYGLPQHTKTLATKLLEDFKQYRSFGRVPTQQQTCNQVSEGFKTTNFKLKLNQHFDFKGLCEDLIKV